MACLRLTSKEGSDAEPRSPNLSSVVQLAPTIRLILCYCGEVETDFELLCIYWYFPYNTYHSGIFLKRVPEDWELR